MTIVVVRHIFFPVWDRLVLPRCGRFATAVVVGVWGRHRATHDLAQWGVSRSGRESVMAVGQFCRNAVGPPEWECEAMDSVVWVKCATSAECVRLIY